MQIVHLKSSIPQSSKGEKNVCTMHNLVGFVLLTKYVYVLINLRENYTF
jgi:hypothetical protein